MSTDYIGGPMSTTGDRHDTPTDQTCRASGGVSPFVINHGLSGSEPPGTRREVVCPECSALVWVTVAADRSATVPEHYRPPAAA